MTDLGRSDRSTSLDWESIRSRAAIDQIGQQPQRQDSLDDQLRDLRRAAVKLGCYDAAEWIRRNLIAF